MPADVLLPRKGREGSVRIAKLTEEGLPFLRGTCEAYESSEGTFISLRDFLEKYREGIEGFNAVGPEVIKREHRVGIGLDRDYRKAKEAMLYSQEFLRFAEGTCLAVLAEEPFEELKGQFVRVGGERRIAFVKEEGTFPVQPIGIQRGSLYKFYCLSHLFVDGGLERGKELRIENLKFRLLWLYSKGSEFISGYRKPFIEMLKPGSVLLMQALDAGGLGSSVCQINSVPPVKSKELESFLHRGWNSGILMEVKP